MQMVQNGKSGSLMGIDSSITNAGMLIGSTVSGELTTTFGYSATFILTIVALAASFVTLSRTSGQKSIVIIETTTKTWT